MATAHRPTAAVSPQAAGRRRQRRPSRPRPSRRPSPAAAATLSPACQHARLDRPPHRATPSFLRPSPRRSRCRSPARAAGSRQAGALFFHRPGRVTCTFIFTFSHSSSDLAIFVALVTLLCTVAVSSLPPDDGIERSVGGLTPEHFCSRNAIYRNPWPRNSLHTK